MSLANAAPPDAAPPNAARPIAALTGGTGFFGRYCALALAEAGFAVRLLVRRDPSHPMFSGIAPDLVPGDLTTAAALRQLVQGARVVVHAAGLVKARSRAAFDAVNRDGAARLAEAMARAAPDARMVMVSSLAARVPEVSDYAASKRAGEAAVAGLADVVVVRPGVIYGPWDLEGCAVLRMARRRLVPVPAPEPRLAMVHARDAAAAVAALAIGGTAGAIHELADARVEGYGWREIVTAAAAGRVPRFVAVPDLVIKVAGVGADIWPALGGRATVFGRGKAREILHRDWGANPAMMPPAGLWTPRIGLADGMRETRDWWDGQGR